MCNTVFTCEALTISTICLAFVVAGSSADEDYFPLLMPKVHPTLVETYLCTPVRLSEYNTNYVIGFKPNATSHTAHHILVYGCEEPGSTEEVYNCGEMSIKQPGSLSYFASGKRFCPS